MYQKKIVTPLLFLTILLGCKKEPVTELGDICQFIGESIFEGEKIENVYFSVHKNDRWTYVDSNWSETDYTFLSTDTSDLVITKILNSKDSSTSKIINLNASNPLSIKSFLVKSDALYESVFGSNPNTGDCYTYNLLFFNVIRPIYFSNSDSTKISLLYFEENKPLKTGVGEFFQYLVHVGDNGKVEYAFRTERGILEERRYTFTSTGERKLIRKVTLLKTELF